MSDQLITNLQKSRVVPLVQAEHPDEAVAVSKALLEGGLEVLEVVLRTDAAFDCLEAVAEAFPDVSVGAGTVLSRRMLKKRLAAVPSFWFRRACMRALSAWRKKMIWSFCRALRQLPNCNKPGIWGCAW